MKLVRSTPPIAQSLLLQSGSLPQLQTSVAAAESTFGLLLRIALGERQAGGQAGGHPQPQTHTQNLPQGNTGQVSTPTQARQGGPAEPRLQKLDSSIKRPYGVAASGSKSHVSPLTNNKRNPPVLEAGIDNLRFFFFLLTFRASRDIHSLHHLLLSFYFLFGQAEIEQIMYV